VTNVEVAEPATGTTVTTGDTRVENNSTDSVTTGTGSVAAGTTGTTAGGSSSSSTTGNEAIIIPTVVPTEQIKTALKDAVAKAGDYHYDDDYNYAAEYTSSISGDTVTINGVYSLIQLGDDSAMNDAARFLGALYRIDNGATVKSITYGGQVYVWNEQIQKEDGTVGALTGSNWVKQGAATPVAGQDTLVSAVVNDYKASNAIGNFALNGDSGVSISLVLSFNVEVANATELTAALNNHIKTIYVNGTIEGDVALTDGVSLIGVGENGIIKGTVETTGTVALNNLTVYNTSTDKNTVEMKDAGTLTVTNCQIEVVDTTCASDYSGSGIRVRGGSEQTLYVKDTVFNFNKKLNSGKTGFAVFGGSPETSQMVTGVKIYLDGVSYTGTENLCGHGTIRIMYTDGAILDITNSQIVNQSMNYAVWLRDNVNLTATASNSTFKGWGAYYVQNTQNSQIVLDNCELSSVAYPTSGGGWNDFATLPIDGCLNTSVTVNGGKIINITNEGNSESAIQKLFSLYDGVNSPSEVGNCVLTLNNVSLDQQVDEWPYGYIWNNGSDHLLILNGTNVGSSLLQNIKMVAVENGYEIQAVENDLYTITNYSWWGENLSGETTKASYTGEGTVEGCDVFCEVEVNGQTMVIDFDISVSVAEPQTTE
jgi:hypothetical protein